MSEQLENVSAESLKQVMDWLKEAKEFAADQAPQLAQEIVQWVWWNGFASVLICAVILIGIPYACRRIWKISKEWIDDNGAEPLVAIFGLIAVGCFIVATTSLIASGSQLIKATVAPRVVIVEAIGKLVK